MGDGLSVADAMALANNARNTDENCGLGGGSWLWVVFLFFLMSWGNGGMWGNRSSGFDNSAVQGALTRSDLFEGFNTQDIKDGVDGVRNAICDSTRGLTSDINAVNTAMLQGFSSNGMNMMQGFNGVGMGIANLGHQIDSCCCTTNRSIDAVRYENAKNTCDIVDAVNAASQRVLDQMTQNQIDALRTELQSAQLQLSNNAQTSTLIASLRPFPQPAYITCSPYTSASNSCSAYCGVAA